jgi:methionyl-tRNA formyltransferase
MRILCCLNRDLASNVALNLLLPAFARHEVRVGLTERVGAITEDSEPAERRELRVAEQIYPNDVLFPLVDAAGFADDGVRYLTFAEIGHRRAIPVAPVPSLNTSAGLELVRNFAPDLIVTLRYGSFLKPPVIGLPRLGVLNLHSGRLPEYRGVLASFRALMNGDAELACTLHYISDGSIDTGDIVGVASVPVRREVSLLAHILSLYQPGVALLSKAIDSLAAGEALQRVSQPRSSGAYYSYPTAEEWAEFSKRGWRVVHAADLLHVGKLYSPRFTDGTT